MQKCANAKMQKFKLTWKQVLPADEAALRSPVMKNLACYSDAFFLVQFLLLTVCVADSNEKPMVIEKPPVITLSLFYGKITIHITFIRSTPPNQSTYKTGVYVRPSVRMYVCMYVRPSVHKKSPIRMKFGV